MFRKYFFIVVLIFSYAAFGQNPEADSVKRLLQNGKEDHEHVMNLEALSYTYLSSYPDTALQYALQGQALAQRINDAAGEASCVIALGNAYFHLGDYAKSLELYLQAIQMKEKLKAQNFSVIYFNMADVYTSQNDFGHALEYLFKAMADDKKRKDSSGILFDLYTLGIIYNRMNKFDSALRYNQQALSLCHQLGDEALLGAILDNHASVYSALRNYPLAIRYYHESLAASAVVDDKEVTTEDYFGLAKIYHETSRSDSARYYAHQALSLAQAAPFMKQLMDISRFLADLYQIEKRWDSAYKYFTLSTATKDSLYNVEEVRKIQTLKFNEQQRQQALAASESAYHQRMKLYLVLLAALVLLIVAVVLWRNNQQKQKAYNLLREQKGITENALQDLKSTQAQLIQAEKMASFGELTAGVAHEIQNPLNFINNFAELSVDLADELKEELQGAALPEKQKQSLHYLAKELAANQQKIHHHGTRASTIVKSMLQHSRRSRGEKSLVDINALVEEFLRLGYQGFRSKHNLFNATLQTNLDKSIGQVAVVRQDIGRVLLNLFNNAFYAVNEKKASLNGNFEPTITVETKRLSDTLEIRVRDNGLGIPTEAVNKIFQPFFTTKPTGEGTGLGLSLAYDIVTKGHDGTLNVETTEGEGSTFILQLPLKER